MKRDFFGYYQPNESELQTLWKNCLFILDANVLLNLYRYSREASDDLLRVLRRVSDRLWIPHQVALEYQQNRTRVIAEQVRRYDEVSKVLSKVMGSLRGELGKLQLEKRHSSIDPSGLLQQVDTVFNQFEGHLSGLKEQQPHVYDDDKLRDQLDSLFEGKVGLPPASQDYLNQLYKEAEVRYEHKRPPGYMDIGKAKDSGAETYLFGELVIQSEYGDLILWKQIVEEVRKREQLEHLIFITDDEKEDWWSIVSSGGDKRLGPRPELAQEIASEAGVSQFYMYNSERFLTFAQRFLNISVRKTSVDQVRDVARLSEREVQPRRFLGTGELAAVEQAVLDWLKSLYPSSIVENHRFPDFVVVDETGARQGYEVKYVRDPRSIIMRLRDVAYRGYYEVAEGNLSTFNLVFVSESRQRTHELDRILSSPRSAFPTNVSVTVGILEPVTDPNGSIRQQFVPVSRHDANGR